MLQNCLSCGNLYVDDRMNMLIRFPSPANQLDVVHLANVTNPTKDVSKLLLVRRKYQTNQKDKEVNLNKFLKIYKLKGLHAENGKLHGDTI